MSVSGGTDHAKNRTQRYAAQHSIFYKSSIFPWAVRRYLGTAAAFFHNLRITQECLILMDRCNQRREMKSREKYGVTTKFCPMPHGRRNAVDLQDISG
jgi:hypothetical protein